MGRKSHRRRVLGDVGARPHAPSRPNFLIEGTRSDAASRGLRVWYDPEAGAHAGILSRVYLAIVDTLAQGEVKLAA